METKSWRALENNAILQYREIYEGRTGLYNVMYKGDNNVVWINKISQIAASSTEIFSVIRQASIPKE